LQIRPVQSGTDDHAGDFANGTPGQAVNSRHERYSVQRLAVLVVHVRFHIDLDGL
jgi:hypothetical protein